MATQLKVTIKKVVIIHLDLKLGTSILNAERTFSFIFKKIHSTQMTSLSYGRIFCLESQKIDGTELRGSTDLAIIFLLLNLEV